MTFERAKNLIDEIVEDWITSDYDDRLDDVLEARRIIFEYAERYYLNLEEISEGIKRAEAKCRAEKGSAMHPNDLLEAIKQEAIQSLRHDSDSSFFCTSSEPTSTSNLPAAKENLYGSNKFNL